MSVEGTRLPLRRSAAALEEDQSGPDNDHTHRRGASGIQLRSLMDGSVERRLRVLVQPASANRRPRLILKHASLAPAQPSRALLRAGVVGDKKARGKTDDDESKA